MTNKENQALDVHYRYFDPMSDDMGESIKNVSGLVSKVGTNNAPGVAETDYPTGYPRGYNLRANIYKDGCDNAEFL